MTNTKKDAVENNAKVNCQCGPCSCGCRKDACRCQESKCHCGCGTPATSR